MKKLPLFRLFTHRSHPCSMMTLVVEDPRANRCDQHWSVRISAPHMHEFLTSQFGQMPAKRRQAGQG